MIRTNLATRPFYNDRTVHLVLVLVALVTAAATMFNATRIVQLSKSDTRLAVEASRDEARAAELRSTAAELRATIDPKQIDEASLEAQRANELIDRRTFSWTDLFNRFETTLPDDVRIVSVRPVVDQDRGIVLTIVVVARSVDEVNQFIEKLEATGAFSGLLSRDERVTDDGQVEAALESGYVPGAARATRGARR
jgi:Tfp pilus assembly protein PilN